MANLTEEDRIKAIPGKAMMGAITAMNSYLAEKEQTLVVFDKLPKADALANLLVPIVAAIEAGEAENLPEEVIAFYNDHLVVEDAPEEKPEKPAKAKKAKKEPKPKKEVPKDAWGCRIGCGANKINELIEAGASTLDGIIEEVGTTKSRVNSHIKSLQDKGFHVASIEGVLKFVSAEDAEKAKTAKAEANAKAKADKAAKKKAADAAAKEKADKEAEAGAQEAGTDAAPVAKKPAAKPAKKKVAAKKG